MLANSKKACNAELGVSVQRERRPTKEYPNGQEVYVLSFAEDGPTEPGPEAPAV